MNETTLQQLTISQQSMTRKAMRLVIISSILIHIMLNVFAYINNDPILKIEMPILSGVTIVAVLLGMRMFRHD
jgi:uncharacterized integral membrane protein